MESTKRPPPAKEAALGKRVPTREGSLLPIQVVGGSSVVETDVDASVGVHDLLGGVVANTNHVSPAGLTAVSLRSEEATAVLRPNEGTSSAATGDFTTLDFTEPHPVIVPKRGKGSGFVAGGIVDVGVSDKYVIEAKLLGDVSFSHHLVPKAGAKATIEEGVELGGPTDKLPCLLAHDKRVWSLSPHGELLNGIHEEKREIGVGQPSGSIPT